MSGKSHGIVVPWQGSYGSTGRSAPERAPRRTSWWNWYPDGAPLTRRSWGSCCATASANPCRFPGPPRRDPGRLVAPRHRAPPRPARCPGRGAGASDRDRRHRNRCAPMAPGPRGKLPGKPLLAAFALPGRGHDRHGCKGCRPHHRRSPRRDCRGETRRSLGAAEQRMNTPSFVLPQLLPVGSICPFCSRPSQDRSAGELSRRQADWKTDLSVDDDRKRSV